MGRFTCVAVLVLQACFATSAVMALQSTAESQSPSDPGGEAVAGRESLDPAGRSIRSREALAVHLATNAPFLGSATANRSPFSRLPDRARQRFIQSLRFHPDHGLVGGSLGLLTRDLTREQADDLLTLIGSYVDVDAITGWRSSITGQFVDGQTEATIPDRNECLHDGLLTMQEADSSWQQSASQRLALMKAHVDEALFDPHAPGVLVDMQNSELDWLWEIVNHVGFYNGEAVYADRLMATFEELARRDLIQPRHVVGSFERLMAARRFTAASALARRYSEVELPKVPTLIDGHNVKEGIVIYRPNSLDELVVEPVDISRGWQVVGMVSRHCGVPRQLLDHLADHPTLLNGVTALWIETVSGSLGLPELLAWNQAQPALAIAIPRAAADWPFVEEMATPQLWLLHDGVVMQTLDGWDHDTPARLADLLAIARHGQVPGGTD